MYLFSHLWCVYVFVSYYRFYWTVELSGGKLPKKSLNMFCHSFDWFWITAPQTQFHKINHFIQFIQVSWGECINVSPKHRSTLNSSWVKWKVEDHLYTSCKSISWFAAEDSMLGAAETEMKTDIASADGFQPWSLVPRILLDFYHTCYNNTACANCPRCNSFKVKLYTLLYSGLTLILEFYLLSILLFLHFITIKYTTLNNTAHLMLTVLQVLIQSLPKGRCPKMSSAFWIIAKA